MQLLNLLWIQDVVGGVGIRYRPKYLFRQRCQLLSKYELPPPNKNMFEHPFVSMILPRRSNQIMLGHSILKSNKSLRFLVEVGELQHIKSVLYSKSVPHPINSLAE